MKQNVASKIKALLEETIVKEGFILWDVTYGKEGGEMLLTVTVDKEFDEQSDCVESEGCGISMEMLSALNEKVNEIIDEADPIDEAYSLMLESAGSERPLRTEEHIRFAIAKGAKVELKLYKAVEGMKEFDGKIQSFDGESLVFEAEIKKELTTDKKCKTKKTVNKAKPQAENAQSDDFEKRTFVFEIKAISKMCAYL